MFPRFNKTTKYFLDAVVILFLNLFPRKYQQIIVKMSLLIIALDLKGA